MKHCFSHFFGLSRQKTPKIFRSLPTFSIKYKFELEHFKSIFCREQMISLRICGYSKSSQMGPQIANLQIAKRTGSTNCYICGRSACTALPRVKFLSNPRRMHSKGEGEEEEEQGLPRAPVCCSTTFPAPSPSPPHTCRAPTGLPGTRYQDTSPPPHCKQAKIQ
jgi:hypothetical protein